MKQNRKQYTPELKRESVALVIKQDHGYEAARLLNINVSVLRRWEKEQRDHGSQAFPGQGHQLPELEEIARLKRELTRTHTLLCRYETLRHVPYKANIFQIDASNGDNRRVCGHYVRSGYPSRQLPLMPVIMPL